MIAVLGGNGGDSPDEPTQEQRDIALVGIEPSATVVVVRSPTPPEETPEDVTEQPVPVNGGGDNGGGGGGEAERERDEEARERADERAEEAREREARTIEVAAIVYAGPAVSEALVVC